MMDNRSLNIYYADDSSAIGESESNSMTEPKDFILGARSKQVRHLDPNIIIADISRNHSNCAVLVSKLRDMYPGRNILVISASDKPFFLKEAFSAGAKGYVMKEKFADIMHGIKAVMEGRLFVSV